MTDTHESVSLRRDEFVMGIAVFEQGAAEGGRLSEHIVEHVVERVVERVVEQVVELSIPTNRKMK